MKLLDKKSIATQVANQRKGQIDEGIALAQKIDKLRATHSSLEQQHNEYVAKMKEILETQLRGLEEGIQAKKKELVIIEEERQKLLEPLDQAWDEYHEHETNLKVLEEELYEKRTQLTLYNQDLDERRLSIEEDEERIESLKDELNRQTEKVTQTSLEAQNTLLEARKEEARIMSQLEQKQKDIFGLEESVKVRERELNIKETHLKKEQKNITKIKLQLEDQRKTLERAMKRYDKSKN